MSILSILKREYEVAFAKNAQPAWMRILKYAIVVGFGIFFWRSEWFWIVLAALLVLSLAVHFWYRYKTKGWTQSFGGWDYEKNKPAQ